MRGAGQLAIAFVVTLAGCGSQPPAPTVPTAPQAKASKTSPPSRRIAAPPTPAEVEAAVNAFAERRREPTLADLAAEARTSEFDLPRIDEERVAATGIRKVASRHLDLYTDIPIGGGGDELAAVFDAAVPLYCEYFGIAAEKASEWKLVASIMQDQERFVRAGLYPESLPEFPHGYNVGSQIWIYEQPSEYYRRHLLLHEGTHAFMLRWLGGAGPPWYMEGMAELVATHKWDGQQLELAVMPRSKEEVPYWGRVKIIKDEVAAGRLLSLLEIMHYDAHAHLKVEAYGWCWGAAAFFDAHPLASAAFKELQKNVSDRTLEFSNRFYERIKGDWPAIVQDWQIFVADCDYGYDFARAAVVHKPAAALPPVGASVTVQTDRGWQSSGLRLEAGKTYLVEATGRYQVAAGDRPWPCEAGGVTIRYVGARPLGMLLGAIADLDGEVPAMSPLTKPVPIGESAELTPQTTGTLYLKINEPAGALADNVGTLTVRVQEKYE